eukprot:GHVU01209711.1.p1 GENE.GHVU01209711.1~~GHVU01209711.1.p1  ORF type:complete len:263 (+),score=40.87 GHVU01209711.1:952-1740(+)
MQEARSLLALLPHVAASSGKNPSSSGNPHSDYMSARTMQEVCELIEDRVVRQLLQKHQHRRQGEEEQRLSRRRRLGGEEEPQEQPGEGGRDSNANYLPGDPLTVAAGGAAVGVPWKLPIGRGGLGEDLSDPAAAGPVMGLPQESERLQPPRQGPWQTSKDGVMCAPGGDMESDESFAFQVEVVCGGDQLAPPLTSSSDPCSRATELGTIRQTAAAARRCRLNDMERVRIEEEYHRAPPPEKKVTAVTTDSKDASADCTEPYR